MERKYGVWLIVLLVLLIAALAAVVMVKNQWDDSKAALVDANERLMQELENTQALSDQLSEKDVLLAEQEAQLTEKDALLTEQEAQLSEKETPLAEKDAQLTEKDILLAAQAAAKPADSPDPEAPAGRAALVTGIDKILLQIAEISGSDDADPADRIAALGEVEAALSDYAAQLTAALDATDAEKTDLAAGLDSANSAIAQLNAQIEENTQTIADLEAQIAEAETTVSLLTAESDSSAEIDELNKQLAAEKQRADELAAQLQAALSGYGAELNELRMYKLSRDPEQGAHYADNALSGDIAVAADGVTAAVGLSNSILSANSISLELVRNGETVAASDAVVPGESISSLTLSEPLAAGEYEATAVLVTCSAEGEALFRQRMPVRITVAAE